MDLQSIFKLKQAWQTFTQNHPKFPAFLEAVNSKGIPEETEILISVTYPDGENLRSGIKVKASDLDLLKAITSNR